MEDKEFNPETQLGQVSSATNSLSELNTGRNFRQKGLESPTIYWYIWGLIFVLLLCSIFVFIKRKNKRVLTPKEDELKKYSKKQLEDTLKLIDLLAEIYK